jgi:hypothetical protein
MTPNSNEGKKNSALCSWHNASQFFRHNFIGLCLGLVIGVLLHRYFFDTKPIVTIPSTSNQKSNQNCPKAKDLECEKFYQGLENVSWVEYSSEFYKLKLPSGIRVTETKEPPLLRDHSNVLIATNFSKEGPTQIHETESYDGLNLNLIVMPKKDLSLQEINLNQILNYRNRQLQDIQAGSLIINHI